ncbi:MAG: glycine--tRNA ligase subunit beta [Nitrospiraceae bacterium]
MPKSQARSSKPKSAAKSSTGRPAPKAASSAKAADLLLEIGTEELPYQFIAPARKALEQAAAAFVTEQRLSSGTIRTVATPRRLALIVEQLSAKQADAVKEAMGPPKSAAFDAAGQPTKAALGFAASHGLAVTDLQERELPKGVYLFAVKQEVGRPTLTLLQEHLASVVRELTFPKAMKWNETGFRFARPLRWILALYGSQVVEIEVGGIRAGRRTYGHRVLGGKQAAKGVTIPQAGDYERVLSKAGVVVDPAKRRAAIEQALSLLAKQTKGEWRADEGLVDQAVYAVEQPAAIVGSFDRKHLDLPADVIETAMKEHQGFFALRDARGALLPNFLAVVNIVARDMSAIRKGNERVLAARLSDAGFYFGEDQKVPLAERVKKLDGVVFHQKLGTMGQKAQRVVQLSEWLAAQTGQSAQRASVRRAAELAKADLTTGVVGEFPALQGIMGGAYASKQGESAEVSAAIRDQYLPRGMDAELPETRVGQIVAVADRLDTIAAFFAGGMTPKGSEDPFALRRHALSVVRILLEGSWRLNLAAALRQATEAATAHLVRPSAEQRSGQAAAPPPASQEKSGKPARPPKPPDDPLPFLLERFKYYVTTKYGLRPDLLDAVLAQAASGWTKEVDLLDLFERLRALQTIASQPAFDPLIVGYKRAHRLVRKEQWTTATVSTEKLQLPVEQALHRALVTARDAVTGAVGRRAYAEALAALVGLKEPVDAFFDGVMVNADDPAQRANRLSLLALIDDIFAQVADFSAVVEPGGA